MRVHVRQKQLPALFKISGGQTMTEHEVRTNLTAKRYKQGIKTQNHDITRSN